MLGIIVNGERLSRMQYNDSTAKAHHAFPKETRFRERRPSFKTEFKLDLKEEVDTEKVYKFQKSPRFSYHVKKSEFPGPGSYDFYDPSKKRMLSHGFGLSVS